MAGTFSIYSSFALQEAVFLQFDHKYLIQAFWISSTPDGKETAPGISLKILPYFKGVLRLIQFNPLFLVA
jgi:hypothetical protein